MIGRTRHQPLVEDGAFLLDNPGQVVQKGAPNIVCILEEKFSTLALAVSPYLYQARSPGFYFQGLSGQLTEFRGRIYWNGK